MRATPLSQSPAVVAIARPQTPESNRYLQIVPGGVSVWVDDPAAATAFASMREATRMALRLPSVLRAFSLPRDPELAVHALH